MKVLSLTCDLAAFHARTIHEMNIINISCKLSDHLIIVQIRGSMLF